MARRKRRKFNPEFKAEAVRLVEFPGISGQLLNLI
jgi:transposase-like protein